MQRIRGRGTWSRGTVAGVAVATVAAGALGLQAVRGNRTVSAQVAAVAIRGAGLDNAYYHCLDVQTRSLVSPTDPVTFVGTNPYSVITLLQAVGSWVTVAAPPSTAVARLSLRYGQGHGCLGTVVIAYVPGPHGSTSVRVGSGADVAGPGPPPPTPL